MTPQSSSLSRYMPNMSNKLSIVLSFPLWARREAKSNVHGPKPYASKYVCVFTFSMLCWCFWRRSRSVGITTLMNFWMGASRRRSVSLPSSSAMLQPLWNVTGSTIHSSYRCSGTLEDWHPEREKWRKEDKYQQLDNEMIRVEQENKNDEEQTTTHCNLESVMRYWLVMFPKKL